MQLLGKPDAKLLEKITADVSEAVNSTVVILIFRLEDMLSQ